MSARSDDLGNSQNSGAQDSEEKKLDWSKTSQFEGYQGNYKHSEELVKNVTEMIAIKDTERNIVPIFLKQNNYIIDKDQKLGEGGFSEVFMAFRTDVDVLMAAKVTNLVEVGQKSPEWLAKCLKPEMRTMKKFKRHENIIRVFEVSKTKTRGFLLMEFAEKKSLSDQLYSRNRPYGEEQTKRFIALVLEGLQSMHGQGLAHRDIKLENILLDRHFVPKLTDFGFVTEVRIKTGETVEEEQIRKQYEIRFVKTHCGTTAYKAPEVINESVEEYDAQISDVYSVGVCTFELLNQKLPFPRNISPPVHITRQIKQQFDWNNDVEKHLSHEAKAFLQKVLEPDPIKRPEVKDLKKRDAWIQSYHKNRSQKD